MNLKSYFCEKLFFMKIFIALFLSFFIINACDDGDVAVQEITFESIAGAQCPNTQTVYKIKGNEILYLKIIKQDFPFKEDQTEANKPRIYNIGSEASVTYRTYSGAVSGANVCDAGTATPNLVEEWTATGGTIEITSTISKNNSTATTENTNAEEIDGYNFLIIFKNITFKKPLGEQFYEEFRFGNFKPEFKKLDFKVFTDKIKKCPTSNNLTSKNGITSLISFDNNVAGLIQNEITSVNNPRISVISDTNNLYYRIFTTNFTGNADYKCATSYTITDPILSQEWKATTGSVQVETTKSGDLYIHKFYLVGVKFKRGNSEFLLGDKFYLGELE